MKKGIICFLFFLFAAPLALAIDQCARWNQPIEFLPRVDPGVIDVGGDEIELQNNGLSQIKGQAHFDEFERTIFSDAARIQQDKTGQLNQIDLLGHVRFYEQGIQWTADEAHSVGKNWDLRQVAYKTNRGRLTARGEAARIDHKSFGIDRMFDGSYTTCPPEDHTWKIKAKKIVLNPQEGRGQSHETILYIKDIPVAYLPYVDFPIDKRRKSGFLFPSFSQDDESGFSFAVPYYFNLAPNHDLLLTPKYYSKRGAMMDGVFRYLTPSSSGDLAAAYLNHDKAFTDFQEHEGAKLPDGERKDRLQDFDADRWSVALDDTRYYNANWSSIVDFNQVSDDYYLQDFDRGLLNSYVNQLNREASLFYYNEHWNGMIRMQSYQTLHPVNQVPIGETYNRQPQILFNANYPDIHHFNYELSSEFDHFTIKHNPDFPDLILPEGNRSYLAPSVSFPFERDYGYVLPKLKFTQTMYDLDETASVFDQHINRTVPIFSVDSGLFFDRQMDWFSQSYQQTFEPRLFYLYAPFHNQNGIPIFDTGIDPFDYSQLFRDNRFNGLDRISDANQISAAVTTRFLTSKTGEEKMAASIGQIYYFRDRKVTLCRTFRCQDEDTLLGLFSNENRTSPIAGMLSYHVNEDWQARANVAYETQTSQMTYTNLNLHYQPKENNRKIVDLNYYFSPNGQFDFEGKLRDLQQASVGVYWPLHQKWNAVAGGTYDISFHRSQLYFYGVEYDSCCWATRLVAERSFKGFNVEGNTQFDNAVYLQFRLKGLGNIGNNTASKLLTKQVNGYQDFFKNEGL